MSDLYRFGISLEKNLIDAFDKHIENRNYRNRSEAIRDLIRDELSRKSKIDGCKVAGAITMIYDHHKRELVNRLLDLQHDYQEIIISTQHVHLDHHHCLEIIAIRGCIREVEKLSSVLKAQTGVVQLDMSVSALGSTARHDTDHLQKNDLHSERSFTDGKL